MGRRWSSVKITCSPFGSVYVSYLISGTFSFKEVSAAGAKTEESVMASIPEKATRPTRMLDCASKTGLRMWRDHIRLSRVQPIEKLAAASWLQRRFMPSLADRVGIVHCECLRMALAAPLRQGRSSATHFRWKSAVRLRVV